jgi:hypothetical protein
MMGEGVTVQSVEEITTPDGSFGAKVKYAVADIRKLRYRPFDKNEGQPKGENPMTFELKGSTLTVHEPAAPDKGKLEGKPPVPGPDEMEAQITMFRPILAGMRLTLQISGADGVESSDATHIKDGQVTLVDAQLDKVMQQPEVFRKLMELVGQPISQSQVAAAFKGVDGLVLEVNPSVTIKLK